MKNIILILIVLIFSSCTFGLDPDTQGPIDIEPEFYMSTADMVLGEESGQISTSATVPYVVIQEGLDFIGGSRSDYPEQGQETTWTVVDQGNSIYLITVETIYPYSSYLEKTVEEYYVQDNGDGEYTDADGIYNPLTQSLDSTYREEYYTEFSNGDIRRETIEVVNNEASFPSEYDGFNFQYSSIVEYDQTNTSFDIGGSNVRISGIRYYGERSDGSSITVIEEEGFATNLRLDGEIRRGRVEVEGRIIINRINVDNKTVNGEYIFSHRGNEYRYSID